MAPWQRALVYVIPAAPVMISTIAGTCLCEHENMRQMDDDDDDDFEFMAVYGLGLNDQVVVEMFFRKERVRHSHIFKHHAVCPCCLGSCTRTCSVMHQVHLERLDSGRATHNLNLFQFSHQCQADTLDCNDKVWHIQSRDPISWTPMNDERRQTHVGGTSLIRRVVACVRIRFACMHCAACS